MLCRQCQNPSLHCLRVLAVTAKPCRLGMCLQLVPGHWPDLRLTRAFALFPGPDDGEVVLEGSYGLGRT